MFNINMVDLVANSFIESLKNDKSKKFLTYYQIEKYGNEVLRNLKNKGFDSRIELSRCKTDEFYCNFGDIFIEDTNSNKELGISLNINNTVKDLIVKFRGYLVLDVLCAFIEEGKFIFDDIAERK